jgi:hypothetical protein
MTNKQLSPEAQAIVNAFDVEYYQKAKNRYDALAAVLCAAANQVVPIEYEDIHGCWYEKKNRVREQFLTIAKELEAL